MFILYLTESIFRFRINMGFYHVTHVHTEKETISMMSRLRKW